jgi:hypothetical protein
VPFLRFSRDKRGYEHTYLVQATNRRGKPVRPRILYWYRTPPGIRLGRTPFDAEVRKTLEAQNPGIVFDWEVLAATQFPAQEPEYWRERRRAEKAAKQARREDDDPDLELAESDVPVAAVEAAETAGESLPSGEPHDPDAALEPSLAAIGSDEGSSAVVAAAGDAVARKRRRRGGRRRRVRPSDAASPDAESAPDTQSDLPDSSSEEQE